AGAVREDEGGPTITRVGDLAEPLDADDEHVGGAAGTDHVVGQRDGVAEARAGRGDVVRGGLVGAQLVGDGGGDRRRLQQVADGGDDDAVDVGAGHAGPLEGDLGRLHRHELHGLVRGGEAALTDAGALLDPFVAGVDRLDDV